MLLVLKFEQASGAVKAMEVFRKKLPAFNMKVELLEAVKNNQVQFFLVASMSLRSLSEDIDTFIVTYLTLLMAGLRTGGCGFWRDRLWKDNPVATICVGGGDRSWPGL
jgi:hypothetical protein